MYRLWPRGLLEGEIDDSMSTQVTSRMSSERTGWERVCFWRGRESVREESSDDEVICGQAGGDRREQGLWNYWLSGWLGFFNRVQQGWVFDSKTHTLLQLFGTSVEVWTKMEHADIRSKLREYTVFEMGLVNGMATKLCGTASSNKHPESELHQSTSIDPRYVQTHFQNREVQQTLRHTPTHSLEGVALELSSAAEHTHKHTVKYHNSAALEN